MQMGPDAILAVNPANFAVYRATVSMVKLKATAGPEGGTGSHIVVLKTTGKTYRITLGGSKVAAREALVTAGLLEA